MPSFSYVLSLIQNVVHVPRPGSLCNARGPKTPLTAQPRKETKGKKKGTTKDVHIDELTVVPQELYLDLLHAAKHARERGQHKLQGSRRREHLVMMVDAV